ncbi:MAG: ATP-grasp domain-containing protein [Pseudomonadales bacterium]|nr:ATP-grasp domain-containing protein [Pseudomonadales bacterium]
MSQLIYEFYSPKGIIKNKNISNSSRLVLKEAEKFGVDWNIISCTQIIELSFKGKKRTFYHQVPSTTSALAKYACNNKKVTTNLLYNNGISVPKGYRVRNSSSDKFLLSVYENLQKPLVVKPSDGALGENITLNIVDFDEYLDAVDYAIEYSGKQKASVIVEEMFKGTEYRILATREKVIGVLFRRPASILGNGLDSIKELIKKKNQDPIRALKSGTTSHLKIRMDDRMLRLLQKNAMDFSSIPPKGKRIFLRRLSNVSQGGDAIDFTDKVHQSVKDIALNAINAVPGLSFAGIDFLSTDITKKQTKNSYIIIEINDTPGFDIHDFPYEGKNRHAAREFLFLMFPELKQKS